ncbi:hypothetical protein [Nonomuraea sp. NPDC049400]|uniref:hypothetical protein n=1 Tax=Nonomuraea sp. NPDC049400 TaxID=3364352 RepID=UPI0037A2330D
MDKRFKPLLDYRQFGYWLYDEHRNLVQLVEHLRACTDLLDPSNPRHLALVLDLTWLDLASLCHAIHAIRSAHVSNPDRGLQGVPVRRHRRPDLLPQAPRADHQGHASA